MALVAYDYSDDEVSESEENEVASKLSSSTVQSESEPRKSNIPKPANVALKKVGLDISWSMLDKHRIKPIRIPIPAVAHDEKEEKVKVKATGAKKGSSLFSMLPKPKSEMVSNTVKTTLKPTSLMRPKPPPKPKPIKRPKLKHDSDSESDTEVDGSFFFSEKEVKPDPRTEQRIAYELSQIEQKVVKSMEKKIVEESESEEEIVEEIIQEPVELTDEMLTKLCGTKDRRTAAPDELIEVDGNELIGDSQQWLVKELTKETVNPEEHKFDGPQIAKRRHQITYLAAHAKANELALQNQWANNRMSRMQTQAKYGF